MSELPIPLFHGTSSLFLDDIIRLGLGGMNPVVEWKVLEFARTIYPLVEKHISQEEAFIVPAGEFRLMTEQASPSSGGLNFQHGDTYLSPVSNTAVRYAVNKPIGSELLNCTLVFLKELLRRKVPGVNAIAGRSYPRIFNLLNVSAAPCLIEVTSVRTEDLAAEDGGDATPTLDDIAETLQNFNQEDSDIVLQQCNFRLRRPVPASALRIWLINVTRWHPYTPEYTLYELPAKEGRHVRA